MEALIEIIIKTVSNGGKISLLSFGHFQLTRRKAHIGRNLQIGAEMQIPARNLPKFRASKKFKQRVN